MGVVIRAYAAGDREACRELWRELTQHHRDLYGDQTIGGADPGDGFDRYRDDPKLDETWVAELEGEIVGLTGLPRDGDSGEVEPVVVRREHRGRGIGRRLVEWVIQKARERGLSWLSIRPMARNALALRRFRQAGFRLLGNVELFLPLTEKDRDWEEGIDLHGERFGY